MSVARSRETATQASERALLRRDFAEAHRLSKEGIDDIIQSSGAEGNTRDLGRQDVGQKDLPVVSLRPSESSDQLNKVSRLVVVFLQASAGGCGLLLQPRSLLCARGSLGCQP